MPDIDGLETAKLIRQYKKSAHTPIIFITAYADEMQTAQGYSLGAVDYILSPVRPDVLRSKVKVFVELYQMQQRTRPIAEHEAARALAEEAGGCARGVRAPGWGGAGARGARRAGAAAGPARRGRGLLEEAAAGAAAARDTARPYRIPNRKGPRRGRAEGELQDATRRKDEFL